MYKGKKVTNPVVHGASGSGGGGANRYSDNNSVYLSRHQSCLYDDLTRAWNSVGKVKSDLRKIEHRLGNADHRQYPRLNETGETTINFTAIMENNQTYDLPDFPSGAVVDNYGRSSYMRSKTQNRKVSRKDENAEDFNDDADNQDNLDHHHRGVKPERRKGNSASGTDKNRDYDKHSRNSAATTSPKRVEFTEQNMERGVNAEGSSSSGATGYSNYNHVNMPSNSLQQTTLTDSRAIRETEIRFLNEHHPSNNIEDEVRMNSQGTKLTHVNVTIPGSTKTTSSIKNSVSGSTHHPLVSNSTSANPTGYNRVADNAALENDRGWETCSLDSASSEDHPISRRIKKSIKDIDLDQDGLAKLKERIRKQRAKETLENDLENMGATGMTTNNDNVPRHAIHNDNEPVQARNYDLPPPEGAADRPRRKVAAGPPAPSYKGFSEAEIRFRHIDVKPTKAYDAKKKEKKKKLASKLQERRQQENTEFVREEERLKPKKATRVIAPSTKKQAKQGKQNEIITTSSWRAGQELILRELGPVKVRRTSKGSNPDQLVETENLPEREMHLPDGATNNIDDDVDNDIDKELVSHKTATAVELERARALSEEARKVLNDLQLDSAEEDDRGKENDGRRRSRTGGKRKAPRSNEPERQQPVAKQKHYDQDEVRKYIQKQKAERLKKVKDDELRQRKADENKRKQLEELRTKQKQNAAMKIIKKSSHYNRNDETFIRPMNYGDLPRHHHFHVDHQRMMVSSESEKDKQQQEDEEEMELSEGSSTLTGESMDELTPVSTDRHGVDKKEKSKNKSGKTRSDQQDTESHIPLDNDSNIKNIGGFKFNVDSVLNNFSQAMNNKRGNSDPRASSAANSGLAASGGSYESASLRLQNDDDGHSRTRAERIQAIKSTAATLQSRIQAEARKITGDQEESGAQNFHSQRTTASQPPTRQSDDEFVSRYDRMTGAQNNYSVFTTNLPGQNRTSSNDGGDTLESAATRIQAAYRGHSVRQNINGKGPPGSDQQNDQKDEDESSITETSTFSEITITEDSENSLPSPRRLGAGLRERDFHAGNRRTTGRIPNEEPNIPRPNRPLYHNNRYSWEDPAPDPYNVLSIFARNQRGQGIPRSSQSKDEASNRRNTPSSSLEGDIQVDKVIAQQSIPSAAVRGTGARSNSPVLRLQSDSPQAVSGNQKSAASVKSRHEPSGKVESASYQAKKDESDEDTLEAESYTQSFESEGDRVASKSAPKSLSERVLSKTHSKPVSGKHKGDLDETDTSSVDDYQESFRPVDQSLSLRGEEGESETRLKEPPRYSPNSLERRFYAELNQLESMEESMRQLVGVERTRAISMAQQETVSLAQMLKARQQNHEREMKNLELKAKQEALEATQQLEDARQRASEASMDAAETIAKFREGEVSNKEVARKLMATRKATAEASRYLAEAGGITAPISESDNIRPKKSTKQTTSISERMPHPESARSLKSTSRMTPSYTSIHSSRNTSRSDNVVTAEDSRNHHGDSDSSIRSVSGAEGRDESKTESIGEDISQASGDEYSITFDDTMTEDEMEDRSFKAILPSESHRKRSKKHLSDNASVTSDEGAPAADVSHRVSLPLEDFVIGEDSFNKFTEDMVRQFMREEEMRAQHQASLLRLREKALVEKTKAELAWLEMQKGRIRNKGADDTYPQIVKRQRGLKMKLQEQQAEIKRLREANKAASRERQMILQQHEEINRMRQTTKQTVDKIKPKGSGGRLDRPSEVHTEDEVSAFDDHSDAADHTQRKDYKSDSEIYTEPKISGKKSKSNAKNVDKYKKFHFDEKFLTAREQKLLDRRKNVEDLLKWKRRLDEEEEKIYKMEQKAIKVWDEHEHKKTGKDEKEPVKAPPRKETKPPIRKEVKDSISETVQSESNIISERVSTAKDDSVRKSYESPKTAEIASGSESSPEEMRRQDAPGRSGSESSIPEEVQSQSSFEEATPGTRKSRASAADSYSNDTFEPSTTPQISRRSNKSPRSPLDKLGRRGFQILSGRDLTTPKSLFNKGRSSESESEESLSHTDVSYTETQSDLSDFEGRVKALTDDLKRRKVEADRLKKERKRRKREILKSKEEALRKQIEAYDNQISQLKADLRKEMEHEPQRTVKPQIKQPKVTPNKNLKKQEFTTPQKSNSNEDGFRSGNSSGYEDSSPSIIEDSKQTSPLVKTPPVSARVSLDKISEGSESMTSRTRTEKSELRGKGQLERSASVKSEISTREDKTEEIEEVLDTQQESETESSYSGILKIDKSPTVPQEVPPLVVQDDASYSLDFTEEPLTGSAQVQDRLALPDSARSVPSENVDSKLLSPGRSISEQISEHVSENIASAQSEDAPFIKRLELQKSEEYDKDIDKESDLFSYSTTKSDSRPSSGKSVSSQITNDDETESESERTPSAARSFDNKQVQNDITAEVKGQMKAPPRKTSQGLVHEGVSDIDKLLGLTGEEDEDEITPVASPRDDDDDDNEEEFRSGDRVLVTGPRGSRCIGNLMFKGKVAFAPGVWAGVELDAPEGRNDGCHDGKRYFTCRPNHGVLVPAADLMPAPVVSGFVSPGRSSQDSSKYLDDSQTDHDEVPDSPTMRKQMKVDKLTNEILENVVRENVNVVSQIADKKTPPPVAPKPRRKPDENVETKLSYGSETNGELRDSGISSPLHREPSVRMGDNTTDKFVGSLLDDALDKMITIRKKQMSQNQDEEEGQHNDLISFDDEEEDFNGDIPTSPTEELEKVLSKEDKDSTPEIPPRPVSPVPGSTPIPNKENLSKLNQDIDSVLGNDGDFIDDDMWPGQKAPPPYPDARPEITRVELQKLTEELYYAVPNKRSEIEKLVASAVDIYWNKRRYGEAIDNVEPPDTYFTKEDNNNDLENNSRRVFKKLLFDLTGEVIQEIYKDDDEIEPPPWQKVKSKRQKYFRGAQPPREVEVLKPIVQEAVIDTLGINGSRKADKNKWSIRKKKDHVDTILVQELREEEPDWVNYDDDELAVKMQLTETIFDSLLSETAQTMNKIYRKRQAMQQK